MRWNGKLIVRWCHRNTNIAKTLKESHWRKLSMIMVWERYCNASPKPEFFLFSLFLFSFISQLIWVCLGWNFHRWFSIQKQVNWCTIDPFSLKFSTSQHSYPVPLTSAILYTNLDHRSPWFEHNCSSPNTTRSACKKFSQLTQMLIHFIISMPFWSHFSLTVRQQVTWGQEASSLLWGTRHWGQSA